MNAYQKNYSQEFIEELPVNFHKIKNMDLSKVPVIFRELFTTDWNWGRYSTMPMQKRAFLAELHLIYQKAEFQNLINHLEWDESAFEEIIEE